MRLNALDEDQFNLHFDVQRSIRYHDRRMVYFERLEKFTNVLTIVTVGLALSEASGDAISHWLTGVAAITALFAACDLVVGFGRMADLHRHLRRRFCALEKRIVADLSDKLGAREFKLERLEIEQDEPPVYRALDILCHNEMMLALGYTVAKNAEHFGYLPWFKRITAQWLHWSDQVDVLKPKS